MVSDEAWVNAQAHQASAGLQHASDLSKDPVERIDVGVEERETNGLEARGAQRQLVRVRLNGPVATRMSEAELVPGEINAADLPAASTQSGRREAGSTPDFDDESTDRIGEFSELRERRVWSLGNSRLLLFIPIGETFILRLRHNSRVCRSDVGIVDERT